MKVLLSFFSLLLAFSIAQAQVANVSSKLEMPELMLEAQIEFARISEVRADERIKMLSEFIKKWTDNPLIVPAREALLRARGAQAETLLKQQKIEPALEQLQLAIKEYPQPLNDRIFGTMLAFPLTVYNHGFRKEALELMRSFEPSAEGQATRLGQLANIYLTAEAGIDALRVLTQAISLEPKSAKYYYALGTTQLTLLKFKEAKAAFQQTINLDPKHPLAFGSLAALYRGEGALEDAVALYKKQLEITPDSESARSGLAITYSLAGENTLATQELGKQFANTPRDFLLFTQLGYLAANRKDYTRSRAWAELALNLAPSYAWARIVLANSLMAQQEFSAAEELLSDALTRGINFPTLHFEITQALLLAENYEGAFEQSEQFLKIAPEGEFLLQIGSSPLQNPSLKVLLESERRAALALPVSLTSDDRYKLVESFLRFKFYLGKLKENVNNSEAEALGRRQKTEIQVKAVEALNQFLSVNDERKAFRKLWAAEELFTSDIALERAIEFCQDLVKDAELATHLEGSIREVPELDLQNRQKLFRARAYHLLGRIRFKQAQLVESEKALKLAIDNFPEGTEKRVALSHLASVTQASGNDKEALSLYIKSYNQYDGNATIQKIMIENLYRKIHGSLEGLDLK